MSKNIFHLQLFSSLQAVWLVRLVEKSYFLVFFGQFWLIFGNLRPKHFRALLKLLKYGVRWLPLQFFWQNFSSTMNIFTVIIEILEKRCFLDDFGLFLEICVIKNVKIRCSVITSSVYLTKLFFCHEYFYSYNRNIEKKRMFYGRFLLVFFL